MHLRKSKTWRQIEELLHQQKRGRRNIPIRSGRSTGRSLDSPLALYHEPAGHAAIGKAACIGARICKTSRARALHLQSWDLRRHRFLTGCTARALPNKIAQWRMSGDCAPMRYPPKEWIPPTLFEQLQYALVVALFNVWPLPHQSDFRHALRT